MIIVTYRVASWIGTHTRVCKVRGQWAKNAKEAVEYVKTHYGDVEIVDVYEPMDVE